MTPDYKWWKLEKVYTQKSCQFPCECFRKVTGEEVGELMGFINETNYSFVTMLVVGYFPVIVYKKGKRNVY